MAAFAKNTEVKWKQQQETKSNHDEVCTVRKEEKIARNVLGG